MVECSLVECSFCGRFHKESVCPGCGGLRTRDDVVVSWETWEGERKTCVIDGVDHFSSIYYEMWGPVGRTMSRGR